MNNDQSETRRKETHGIKNSDGYKIKLPFTKYTQQEMSHEEDIIWFIVK